MTIHKSDYAKGLSVGPNPSWNASGAAVHRFAMAVPTTVAANDILELAPIPANCRVVDITADSDDLDSNGAPAIVMDVGIMTGEFGEDDDARTCGAEFFSASTLGQAGGVARATTAAALRTGKAGYARSIGVKISTVAATPQAGSVGVTVTLAP